MTIRRLLVANRGEIAARVFRTCDRLGIDTVAVVAPDDAGAYHARRAGSVEAVESYLSGMSLVRAAERSGADAVHPGYGFLAEDASFAETVLAAGLVWVGPAPEAMRAAGDKLRAKAVAASAGVPTLPSGSPEDVGFPLILKAAAGGGGRGMRVVRSADELGDALEAARREAGAAFGDDTVFAERLVERARHVEVQLLGDSDGRVVHLGARDCSLQRRHQKVLEETPAPGLGPQLLERLCEAAVVLGRGAGYENAGTAEFLVADDGFWFIELNARLQVEHPATELVTGLDLVEQQLALAAGGAVPDPPRPRGHAVEVRLYAEHPVTFLPQAGVVERLELPAGIRVDAGVEQGDGVPVAYDPLIAKLVAHGPTRAAALERLAGALGETRVGGVVTNLPFLQWLVSRPEVIAGETTTAFLAGRPPLSDGRPPAPLWAGFWRLNRDPARPLPPRSPPPLTGEQRGELAAGALERSEIRSPMPGTIVRVLVAEGDRVGVRQPVVVLEAMKMETPLVAPYEAEVRRLHVAEGERVQGGALLVELGQGDM